MKTVLTADQDAQILARYLAGERVQDLADEYGVSTPTVYNRIPVEQRRARGGGPRLSTPPDTAPVEPPAVQPAEEIDEDLWRKANPAINVTIKPVVASAFKEAQITHRGATFGYYPPPCDKPQCGTDDASPVDVLPIVVTDVRVRGKRFLRFCTWHCLSRHAIRAELAGGDA